MKEGWICPKCGKVLAPWMPECSCFKETRRISNAGSAPSTQDTAYFYQDFVKHVSVTKAEESE